MPRIHFPHCLVSAPSLYLDLLLHHTPSPALAGSRLARPTTPKPSGPGCLCPRASRTTQRGIEHEELSTQAQNGMWGNRCAQLRLVSVRKRIPSWGLKAGPSRGVYVNG